MPTPEPSPLDALQSALEARVADEVTTTLGPLAALRDALVAYETAIRDQLARDAFAAIPEIATAIPAPDVPAARLAVLTALRAAARTYQAPPAAIARTALETALVVERVARDPARADARRRRFRPRPWARDGGAHGGERGRCRGPRVSWERGTAGGTLRALDPGRARRPPRPLGRRESAPPSRPTSWFDPVCNLGLVWLPAP